MNYIWKDNMNRNNASNILMKIPYISKQNTLLDKRKNPESEIGSKETTR